MTGRRLLLDPLLPWEGPFPYHTMARFGIGPETASRDIVEATFQMSPDDLHDPTTNAAWQALRTTRSRLLVDLFCHGLPPIPDPAVRPRGVAFAVPSEVLESLVSAPEVDGVVTVPEPDLPEELPPWPLGAEPARSSERGEV